MAKEQSEIRVEEVLAASLAKQSDAELTKLSVQFDEIAPRFTDPYRCDHAFDAVGCDCSTV